jgi:type I restriction enzyme M protein
MTSGEGDIRANLVKEDLVECIVALPKQLFYNTGIPATIWILRRGRTVRNGETLFIDASEMGYMKTRVHREFSDDDMQTIESTYHKWRKDEGYEDVKGFCKSAKLEEMKKHNFVLTPGRYVGIPDEEDDGIPFADKMADLTTTLAEQMKQEKILDEEIKVQLAKIGFEL